MKKRILILTITINFLLITTNLIAQPCLPEGITFNTQAQIDSFQINYPGCTEIEGFVHILWQWGGTDINNLNGLINLTAVGGGFTISGIQDLTSLIGLENITSIGGDLSITNNSSLTVLIGLENLEIIGGALFIGAGDPSWYVGNYNLHSIEALGNVNYIGGGIYIIANSNLNSLAGLENITSISGDVFIEANSSLKDLNGLNNLTTINGNLEINCDSLNNLNGLENLSTIGGTLFLGDWNGENNLLLTSISGLSSLTYIGGNLCMVGNDALTSLMGLENLTSVGGHVYIGYWYNNIGHGNQQLVNLMGLNELGSVGGSLRIHANSSLIDFSGLENLAAIGGDLEIVDNENLVSINALSNLTSMAGDLFIYKNDVIPELTGLDNIDASLIKNLYIHHNNYLSVCNVPSICDYIANPVGNILISNNDPGCESYWQVMDSCNTATQIQSYSSGNAFIISPNPFSNQTTIEFTLPIPGNVILSIFDITGKKLETILSKKLPSGYHQINWNASSLKEGIYFIRMETQYETQIHKAILLN